MPFCPNCGSYVSPGSNVCSCGTTFDYNHEIEKETESEYQRYQGEIKNNVDEWCRQGRRLMDDGEYLRALEYFDRALEIFPEYHEPIFNKAKAYYYAGMYKEALKWFKKSKYPQRSLDNFVILEWIGETLIELYRFNNAVKAYSEAIDIVNDYYGRTMNFHEGQRVDRPSDEYLRSLLDEKNERITYLNARIGEINKLKREVHLRLQSDTDEQERYLKNIGRENFITITGTDFYGDCEFEKGMRLKLVKEDDNEFDGDAVAVYLNDDKAGYVANSSRTACYLTSQARDIQIRDVAYVEYMFCFAYKYHIARILE